MILKETELINLIKRVINESEHSGSYMAKKQLWSIAEKAEEMAERLPDGIQLDDWMESHIAKADSMMDSVYDSFDYDNQSDMQTDMPGFEGTLDALKGLTLNEQTGTGHDKLMDGIDKMCIDRPWENEKLVGNKSCRQCHPDLMGLIKDYCGGFSDDADEGYLDDPGMGGGTPSVDYQLSDMKESANRMNEWRTKTKTIGSFPLCCLWFCGGCDWTWGDGQWSPPAGSGNVSAGKYANVAPNKSHKQMKKKRQYEKNTKRTIRQKSRINTI